MYGGLEISVMFLLSHLIASSTPSLGPPHTHIFVASFPKVTIELLCPCISCDCPFFLLQTLQASPDPGGPSRLPEAPVHSVLHPCLIFLRASISQTPTQASPALTITLEEFTHHGVLADRAIARPQSLCVICRVSLRVENGGWVQQ